ncbi:MULTISPECIES: SDR family NAD(P)-dependent oxidoreductase [Halomonas]|uniref:SDR family NAD(P)-dependent oxidoreductase n=1 Tax=Halomonas TaxID=2745 RepID=UPI001C94F38A|nr:MULTISPECIES: SDR family NAD(P)-dependent oxidoreductase [Halomonas]MBY6207482.1 SDR family NAD(P)-dependent oxidoreductase [Halomonas sp. DP3Y7-2]MBY6228291.1 SDR family NAD(P)-dependent oxidoreductase [Halomonas sp. DP3Y7-1]MCA0916356.1 SDR family NAD(P)-dependent oxidoreductase [Halomonas denitrificans]
MPKRDAVITQGRVAVITGAAKGIGAAAARILAQKGMKLALLDSDKASLEVFAKTLDVETLSVVGDVSEVDVLRRFKDQILERFGDIALVMNNAAIKVEAGPWDSPHTWQKQMDVNFGGMLAMHHVFVPELIVADKPAMIVNLGSKEGITTPPGFAGYSVSKAGVKVLTEQLAYELRNVVQDRVSAHLLVPGYTWTPMNGAEQRTESDSKPDEAWTAEQVIQYALAGLNKGEFYIICPDNAVTSKMDAKRIEWAANDMIQNRPALSRWHPDYADKFKAYARSAESWDHSE